MCRSIQAYAHEPAQSNVGPPLFTASTDPSKQYVCYLGAVHLSFAPLVHTLPLSSISVNKTPVPAYLHDAKLIHTATLTPRSGLKATNKQCIAIGICFVPEV